MEPKSRYALVGFFVLSLTAAFLVFLLWVTKTNLGEPGPLYDVYFEGSVNGLRKGEQVTYYGVPIGSVEAIRVDPYKLDKIRVTVSIETPQIIREDAIATLELKGITGQAEIQIHGSSKNKPLLVAKPGEEHPVITFKRSKFQQIVETAPEITQKVVDLVGAALPIFDEENRKNLADTLKNLREFTNTLATQKTLLSDLKTALVTLTATLDTIKKESQTVSQQLNTFVGGLYQAPQLLSDTKVTLKEMRQLMRKFSDNPREVLLQNNGMKPLKLTTSDSK